MIPLSPHTVDPAQTESDAHNADHPTWPAPPPDMDLDDAPTATEEP